MEQSIIDRLDAQDAKLAAIHDSVEKTRKYLLIIMWSSVAMIVLPLLAGLIIVPIVLSSVSSLYSGVLTY